MGQRRAFFTLLDCTPISTLYPACQRRPEPHTSRILFLTFMTSLVQLKHPSGNRHVALVDGQSLHILEAVDSIYALCQRALAECINADLGPSRHARQGVDPLRSGIPELRLADTAGVCYTIPPYPAIAWSAVRVSRTAPASTTATRCIGKRRVTDARSRSPTTTLRIPPPR